MVQRMLLMFFALAIGMSPAQAQKRIALTFDDVPRNRGAFLSPDQRTEALIAGLRRAHVKQAAFFVNAGNLEKPDGVNGEAHIRAYVAAGHVIGNHSWSHPHLTELSAADYLANMDRGWAFLKGRKGLRPWYRFPFLDEGGADKAKRDAVRAGLRARSIRTAYVTIDGSDWNMEALTSAAMKAGKPVDMAALKDLYVETLVGAADYYDGLMVRTIGRSPAHVILMHETDLAALFVEDFVKALRADGWEIVTADQAFADPINRLHPDVPSAQGTLTEALAWEKGLPAPRWYERDNVPFANALFARRVLHEAAPAP